MKTNFFQYKEKFKNDGYFVIKNFVDKNFISKLIEEINNSKNTDKYYDNANNLRRIEKLFNKGQYLINLDKKFSTILKNILDKDFLIFKDKFNSKPPGGEGFFAHYDGIFQFINSDNQRKKGWYEYGDFFVSALVAIDKCNKENGALEFAKHHEGNFEQLYENTKKDGTPSLSEEVESKTSFNLIDLDIGDMIIFSHKCPHRSKRNDSKNDRRIIYYTYSLSENGSKYDQYFEDKKNSKNESKALSVKKL
jgi:ectoine hydroxylase-related dioxygenase (phytanoyl-CoA dioxygenase family)